MSYDVMIVMMTGREGEWLWVHNDVELEFDIWGEKSPSNKSHNTQDCGVMVLRNNLVVWEDHSCTAPEVSHHSVAPVCQADTEESLPPSTTTTTTPAPTTTPFSCQPGWSAFNGSCYKFFYDSTQTWTSAMTECLTEGAALTSVHSREEDDFLNDLAEGNSYWLGGYPNDNTWVWADYTDFDYTHNYGLTPGSGNCILQPSSTYGSGWNDYPCSSSSYRYNYICKKMS